MAATAAKVAKLPLDGGDHRITTRVRDTDTDPDTEVGLVGETLNQLLANVDSALAALAESDRRTRQFLTDASHELRTPLAAIQGYAELTRQDSATLPPTTEYALARIGAEARRMTGLVSDLWRQSTALLMDEVELAKAEMAEKTTHVAVSGGAIAIGGAVLFAGFIVLLLAAVNALAG